MSWQAIFDVEDGIWRCALDAWEIETDDGITGYCKDGHQFNCPDIKGFEAADRCEDGCDSDDSDDESNGTDEGLDEYEDENLLDDDEVEDPYESLTRSIKDIDNWDCDDALLIRALDEIDNIEDGYKILTQKLNCLDVEESGEEEPMSGNYYYGNKNKGIVIEEKNVMNEEDKFNSDGKEVNGHGREANCDGKEANGDSKEINGDGKDANGDVKEAIGDGGEATGEADSVTSEDKAASEGEDDASDEDYASSGEDDASSEDEIDNERVEKLKGTIQFLTNLCEGEGAADRFKHCAFPVVTVSFQVENLPSESIAQEEMTQTETETETETEAGQNASEEPLLFKSNEIETLFRSRSELIRDHEINPPINADKEFLGQCDEDVNCITQDLVDAIKESRLARNATKKLLEESYASKLNIEFKEQKPESEERKP